MRARGRARGLDPGQFETLSERVAIGSTEFLDRVKRMVSVTSPEQPAPLAHFTIRSLCSRRSTVLNEVCK